MKKTKEYKMASRANFPNRVEKRRADAKVRQEKSDGLTLDQKLAKATPGSREHMRLTRKKTDLVTGTKRA
jgi:hypothetical protein